MDEKILITAKIVFVCLGFVVACVLYIPIILKVRKEQIVRQTHNMSSNDAIDKALLTLKNSKAYSVEEKADAFITLILKSYVLVHTMINTGNKYDDKIQTRHFKELLAPDIAEKLNSLEDKNEQRTI